MIKKMATSLGRAINFRSYLRDTRLLYYADVLAALMAISLPWSTTILGIFTLLWLIVLASAIDIRQFGKLIKRLSSALPVALFSFGVVGMLWADASWAARMHAAASTIKLLAIPLLIYQIERSPNGINILLSFLVSCFFLLALSWLNWFEPRTVLFPQVGGHALGVPVKNWITQGVEFTLCIFGSAALAIYLWRNRCFLASIGLGLCSIAFLLNMIFVVSSRTSLSSIPVLVLISTLRYIGWKRSLALYAILAVLAGVGWFTAPNLRIRIESIREQYTHYTSDSQLTSVGLRIEYWTSSLKFISTAPLIGHGTGSIRSLFERAASSKTVTPEQIVANPHNQTLYFAIEWGAIGIALLWAMWIVHFMTFTEMRWISWMGIIVVSQNIFDSLFNSHISDYVEGWIYVIGVGVAAGMISRSRKPASATTPI